MREVRVIELTGIRLREILKSLSGFIGLADMPKMFITKNRKLIPDGQNPEMLRSLLTSRVTEG